MSPPLRHVCPGLSGDVEGAGLQGVRVHEEAECAATATIRQECASPGVRARVPGAQAESRHKHLYEKCLTGIAAVPLLT